MRPALIHIVAAFVLLLTGCTESRRSVRDAPGYPALFEERLPQETKLLPPTPQTPSSGCTRWSGAPWCETLLGGWSFVDETLEFCAAEADEDDAVACLSHAAERRFSSLALETCAALDKPGHRLDCIDAVADRALEAPQFHHCTSMPSKKVAGCLEDMHEYVFHPNDIRDIVAKTAAESPTTDAATLIKALESTFATQYDLDVSRWPDGYVFNFAGGATTHIRTMYCALDEYLLIVGAPINVNGYSGRYPAEVHDFVFTGLMHDFEERDHAAHEHEAGSWAFLPHGKHRVYATENPTYMVEYARGWIPGMLNFGIRHPKHAITRDRKNMRQQIKMCAQRALDASGARRKRNRERRKSQRKTRRAVRRALRGL